MPIRSENIESRFVNVVNSMIENKDEIISNLERILDKICNKMCIRDRFPLIPNGCIPYIATNTKINLKSFSIAVFFGSIPSILIFCAIGNQIMEREFAFAIFLFAIFFICLLLLIIFRNRILKVIINLKNKYSGKIISKH